MPKLLGDPPSLLTFDVFGTIVDWRGGLRESVARYGISLDDALFDRVVDAQGRAEQAGPFRPYREIVAASVREVLGLDSPVAAAVGAEVGEWPAFRDSPAALARLSRTAPCVAMTNSDVAHGEAVQGRLGLRLSAWFCAEDVRCYKPDPRFWREVAARLGVAPASSWWHVSAYADYDLEVARSIGLTTVFVSRPHARAGEATHAVGHLEALADLVAQP